MPRQSLFIIMLIAVAITLSGCSEIELASHFGKKMTGSTVKSQGYYKVGSPYTIKGKRYYPAVNYGYNETGIASWYGPNFHGKMTANGERFDENELTAAHKTLPLPSIVRVTNLENGRSLIVRVNDRGPYAHGRIIDMSKRSAELLGFQNKGVAKVRVQVLESESKMVANVAKSGKSTNGMEVPMNRPNYQSPTVQTAAVKTTTPTVQQASLHKSTGQTIPGHVKQGNFYPDPVISEVPVTAQYMFVQVGSFSSRDAAMRYASSLDGFGRAQIYPATVNGKQFYRVRFPAKQVSEADTLLNKLIQAGHKNALILVD
ncbi:MAG: septal ring lytic transglycosylase RlpA family protein [Alcanivorax sp.]